jgi:hypothetical protein
MNVRTRPRLRVFGRRQRKRKAHRLRHASLNRGVAPNAQPLTKLPPYDPKHHRPRQTPKWER